jgi:hypothetical protein
LDDNTISSINISTLNDDTPRSAKQLQNKSPRKSPRKKVELADRIKQRQSNINERINNPQQYLIKNEKPLSRLYDATPTTSDSNKGKPIKKQTNKTVEQKDLTLPITKQENFTLKTDKNSVKFSDEEVKVLLIPPVPQKPSNDNNKQQQLLYDQNLIKELTEQNKMLLEEIDDLNQEMLDKEIAHKQKIDMLMIKYHDNLKKELKSHDEKEALTKIFLNEQQENNEKIMNEQSRKINTLEIKCERLQKELKERITNKKNEDKENIPALQDLVHRLNIELSSYQAKFQALSSEDKSKVSKIKGLPQEESIPIWLIDNKYLSPLIASYDDHLKDKDNKLKLMKTKIDDLMEKFNEYINENNELHAKLQSDSDPIRNEAKLVLEENRTLNEQLQLQSQKFTEIQKKHIQEISNLSKRNLIIESEKIAIQNEAEILKTNLSELARKYNDASVEQHRRVTLDEHLNQIGDLKRKIEEIKINSKLEIENLKLVLQVINQFSKFLKEMNFIFVVVFEILRQPKRKKRIQSLNTRI